MCRVVQTKEQEVTVRSSKWCGVHKRVTHDVSVTHANERKYAIIIRYSK